MKGRYLNMFARNVTDLFGIGRHGRSQTISAEQAKKIMDSGENCVILDVRAPDEYRSGHIRNAKLIPVSEIKTRAGTELPDKSQQILVYCQSGYRAGNAVSALVSMGYTKAASFGGICSWPYEITTD